MAMGLARARLRTAARRVVLCAIAAMTAAAILTGCASPAARPEHRPDGTCPGNPGMIHPHYAPVAPANAMRDRGAARSPGSSWLEASPAVVGITT